MKRLGVLLAVAILATLTACAGDDEASETTPATTAQEAGPTFSCEPRKLLFRDRVHLEGAWAANDDGVYYIRHTGDTIWWSGMYGLNGPEANLGKTWNNVFRGTVAEDQTIRGEWTDVPRGDARGAGKLVLKVEEAQDGGAVIRMVSQDPANEFGGSEWTPCTPSEGAR